MKRLARRLTGWLEAATPFVGAVMMTSGVFALFFLVVGQEQHILSRVSQGLWLVGGGLLLVLNNPKKHRLLFAKRVVTYIHRHSGTVAGSPHLLIESADLANNIVLMTEDPDWEGLDDDG